MRHYFLRYISKENVLLNNGFTNKIFVSIWLMEKR